MTGAALALMMLAACSSAPDDPAARAEWEEANDPIEDFNRYIHDVNYAFDQLFFRPLAGMYRTGVPEPMRNAFRNFFDNARAPIIMLNDLLQGKPKRAGITVARFLTNTTLGLAGFIDVADMLFDLEFHDEDFGQTLAVWGAGEGFYLVLPVFGPSNPRDAIGLVVDSVLDPWNFLMRDNGVDYGPWARSLMNAIDLRARNIDTLDEIERTSIDYYATLRSLYRQRRADQISDGIPSANQPVPAIRGTDEGLLDLPEPTTPQAYLRMLQAKDGLVPTPSYESSPLYDLPVPRQEQVEATPVLQQSALPQLAGQPNQTWQ